MLVYIAMPYRGKDDVEIEANIQAARSIAIKLVRLGYDTICPHLNTCHFERDCGVPDNRYLAMDLAILARCDALLLGPRWQESVGVASELVQAKRDNQPIYEWLGPDGDDTNLERLYPPLPAIYPIQEERLFSCKRYRCNKCQTVWHTQEEAAFCCPEITNLFPVDGTWIDHDELQRRARQKMGCGCEQCCYIYAHSEFKRG